MGHNLHMNSKSYVACQSALKRSLCGCCTDFINASLCWDSSPHSHSVRYPCLWHLPSMDFPNLGHHSAILLIGHSTIWSWNLLKWLNTPFLQNSSDSLLWLTVLGQILKPCSQDRFSERRVLLGKSRHKLLFNTVIFVYLDIYSFRDI